MFPTSIWIEGLVSPPSSFCQLKQKHNIFKSFSYSAFIVWSRRTDEYWWSCVYSLAEKGATMPSLH